jgi:hypothetical protein
MSDVIEQAAAAMDPEAFATEMDADEPWQHGGRRMKARENASRLASADLISCAEADDETVERVAKAIFGASPYDIDGITVDPWTDALKDVERLSYREDAKRAIRAFRATP